MDGRNRRGLRRGASALVALSLANGLANAQAPPPAGMAAVSAALGHMKTGGAPLVVVVTSSARPESRAFFRALNDGPWARANRGLVQVVELPAEGNAATIERLRVASVPSVLAYTAGPEGPVCRGLKAGGSIDEATAWLGSLGIGDARMAPPTADPSVIPANHDGYPSAQQPAYYPPAPAPAPAPTVPAYAQAAPPAPSYAAPALSYMVPQAPAMAQAAGPASFVQLPGPNVVVQQGEARVFLAPPSSSFAAPPAPAGNLYLPAASSAAPALSYAAPSAPAMAFAAPSAPAYAYAAPMAAAPAMSFAAAPAPAFAAAPAAASAAPAVAPAAAFAAPGAMAFGSVTNQTIGVPSSGMRTRVRVRGPGPIRSGLASLGERMTQLGRARIETIQETELNTPVSQGSGNVATFTSSGATPLPPQIQTYAVPQAAPPSVPAQAYSAPPVTPSPQGGHHKHGLFHKDDN